MSQKKRPENAEALRARAEAIAGDVPARDRGALSVEAAWDLLHELQVHQIELGLQNEELQRSQEEIEKARARYFDLYDMAPVGYLSLDEKNTILEGNLTFARLMGVTKVSLPGRVFAAFLVPEDTDVCHLFFKELFRARAARSCELRLLRSDGRSFWVRVDATVSVDAAGIAAGHAAVIDISQQRQLEDVVKSSEERFRAVFNNASDGMLLWELGTRRIVLVNRQMLGMLGYAEAHFLEMSVIDLHPASDLPGGLGPSGDYADRGVAPILNLPMKCRDGTVFYADLTEARISLRGRDHILGIYRDARSRKQGELYTAELAAEKASAEMARQKMAEIETAYLELQRTQDMLVQSKKMSALGMLSAGMAHELNNPLTGILEIVRDNLKEKDPHDKEYGDLQQIAYAGERMVAIIKGLLVFSRPSTGGAEELRCENVIETVLAFSQRIMRGRNIVVKKEFEKDLPLVKVSHNRLQQVVFNIIHNAFDAMENKGVLRIAARHVVEGQAHFVEMEFTDSGCGVAKEDLPRLFDPFFTTKSSENGTGLGLAVSYSIVREYGGEILVESPPAGQANGASFKVRLPALSTG